MHTIIAIRGVKHHLDLFISQLQGKYTSFDIKEDSKDGKMKKGTYMHPIQVRPIQMYEIVFPKESKDIMLTTLLGKNEKRNRYPQLKASTAVIRKALGLKKIPEYDDKLEFPIDKKFLQILGIGVKEDAKENGTEML